jgi:hypothetical protein
LVNLSSPTFLIATSLVEWQAVPHKTPLLFMTEKEALQHLISQFPGFENWDFSKELPIIAWFLYRFHQPQLDTFTSF